MNRSGRRRKAGRNHRKSIVIAIVVIALAALVAVVTLGDVYRQSAPALALGVNPFDALARAQVAVGIAESPNARERADADSLALRSLKSDALAAQAATALALNADATGKGGAAAQRFAYIDRITRRNLPTHLWFIEQRVRAGDVPGALHRYDLALRAFPGSAALLYSVLNTAVSDDAVADQMNALLRTRPPWRDEFLAQLIAGRAEASALVRVTRNLFDRSVPGDLAVLLPALQRMAGSEDFADVWTTYRTYVGNTKRTDRFVRDGDFLRDPTIPPFEWFYASDPDLAPERRPIVGSRDMALFLPPSPTRDGDVATQLLRLPPGNYRFAASVGDIQGPEEDRPRIAIDCAVSGTQAIALAVFPTADKGAVLGFNFAVPASCPYQWLKIRVRQSISSADTGTPRIDSIRISRS